jgi:hypothetical protein
LGKLGKDSLHLFNILVHKAPLSYLTDVSQQKALLAVELVLNREFALSERLPQSAIMGF